MIRIALFGGFVPAVLLAGVLLAPLFIKTLRGAGAKWFLSVFGVSLGLLIADYASHGVPDLWPVDTTYRIPHIVLALGAWALIERALSRLGGLIAIGRFFVGAGCALVILIGVHPHYLGTAPLVLWCVGSAIAMCVLSVAKPRAVSDRWLTLWQLVLLAAISGAMAHVLFRGGSAVASQLAAGCGALSVSAFLTILVFKRAEIARACFYILSGYLVVVALCGYPMGDVSIWALGACALAALAPRLDRLAPRKRCGHPLIRVGQALFAMGALGAGVAIAERDASSSGSEWTGAERIIAPDGILASR